MGKLTSSLKPEGSLLWSHHMLVFRGALTIRPKKKLFVCPFPTDQKITKILGRVFIFIFFISIYNFKKFWIFAKKISLKKNLYFSHIFLSIFKPKRICFYQQKIFFKKRRSSWIDHTNAEKIPVGLLAMSCTVQPCLQHGDLLLFVCQLKKAAKL